MAHGVARDAHGSLGTRIGVGVDDRPETNGRTTIGR